MNAAKNNYFLQDIIILLISIGLAIVLVKSQIIHLILTATQESGFAGSFIAGLFFTSIFTTAPAIVTLGEISQSSSIISVAFFGALGAVMGDLIIFKFVRDRFSDHVLELLRHRKEGKKIKIRSHLHVFRWLSFFVGGLIIASPLPDELGISFFGFSKMNLKWFMPTSFIFNFAGILLIGIVANSL